MDLKVNSKSFFVFDLDDTLYNEIDFVKSGFKKITEILFPFIGHNVYFEMLDYYLTGKETLNNILNTYKIKDIDVKELLRIYRCHFPNIKLKQDAKMFLDSLLDFNIKIGIITDGRSLTQRNKLKALNIIDKFDLIIISEEFGFSKPNINNYKIFEDKFPGYSFYFFGDNIGKDFISPNKLCWESFCLLDKGRNIHKKDYNLGYKYLPNQFIKSFSELNLIYEK